LLGIELPTDAPSELPIDAPNMVNPPQWKNIGVVGQTGLEPATCCLGGSCSIHLSYWPITMPYPDKPYPDKPYLDKPYLDKPYLDKPYLP
jgi:hypothetical protein